MHKAKYLSYLNDVFSMHLLFFGIILAVLAVLLMVFLIVRRLRNKAWYVVLLILGVLIVGGVEIIPLRKDIKNSSITMLNNVEYRMIESGGLRSKNYTMVVTIPNSEKVYSIKCGAMQETPHEGKNVTIVFAEHSKMFLDIVPSKK